MQDFNARWFDTSLGAFASPDSLVQYAFAPQALNRYGYVLNNPLRYTDPTGHRACEGPNGECWYTDPVEGRMPVQGWQPTIQTTGQTGTGLTTVRITGDVTPSQREELQTTASEAIELSGESLSPMIGGSPDYAFYAVLGNFELNIDPSIQDQLEGARCRTTTPIISCWAVPPLQTLLHELGHVFDVRYQQLSGGDHLASDLLPTLAVGDVEMRLTSAGDVRTDWGFMCGGLPCLASQEQRLTEELADTYMNWVLDPLQQQYPRNGFMDDDYGNARRDEWQRLMRTQWLPGMGFEVIP